ncbi:MAG: hypothetical protein QOE92_2308 [Chloroflexota bacterium]|jgi:ATP-dependent protease HslVU (ClpYQ) peptidase subunit|nr:hypothetical protein [Chloroflexota bacterium]
MTVIIGIAQDGLATLAGDSAETDWRGNQVLIAEEKVFRFGDVLVGTSGSPRVAQLIRFKMKAPELGDADPLAYLVKDFIPKVRKCLAENSKHSANKSESEVDGVLLVGCRGRVFEIDSYLSVSEPIWGYAAIGIGAPVALGALYATRHLENVPRRIELAMEAAERHRIGVMRPFVSITESRADQPEPAPERELVSTR